MADGYRRVEETEEAFERMLASKIAEETQPLRAALEASKSECEALRKRAAELEASFASRGTEEQTAIPGLPDHLVVAHILGSGKLNDPTDLVRLTAVSRGMRAAVAAKNLAAGVTTLTVKEPTEKEAVEKGYLTTLKRMHSRGRWFRKELLCEAAAKSGQLEELKSLRAVQWPWNEWTPGEKWPWNEWTCTRAAEGGHLEVLKWARENGCWFDMWTCWYAAKGGHLEVLKYARANHCEWTAETCAIAAHGGHLEVLKWARQNGCPWCTTTCRDAVSGGHLEVLKWARENGCPWGQETRIFAAKKLGYVET